MNLAAGIFEALLGLLLLVLAVTALHARSLYAGAVLFIAFGVFAALTWAYLGAPDLALAEAAISAGLTGVLLFAALARIGNGDDDTRQLSIGTVALPLAAGAMILAAVLPLVQQEAPLPALVSEALPQTGVANPVTGVLLNFRAWDTLLEILVLLIALLGSRDLRPTPEENPAPWALLSAWSRVLVPLLVLFGIYLLWRGSDWPGGAFQAAAMLAAGAVLLRLNGLLPQVAWRSLLVRGLVLSGLLLFSTIAALTAWLGAGWLDYPTGWDKAMTVLVEVFATLSITVILTMLVSGNQTELQS